METPLSPELDPTGKRLGRWITSNADIMNDPTCEIDKGPREKEEVKVAAFRTQARLSSEIEEEEEGHHPITANSSLIPRITIIIIKVAAADLLVVHPKEVAAQDEAGAVHREYLCETEMT